MQAKKYQFGNIVSELSVKLFEDHWKLYENYVNALNDNLKKFSNPYDPELLRSAKPSGGPYRSMEADRIYLSNAVMLHELFFENVILPEHGAPLPIGPQFTSMVQQYFPHVKSNDFWSHIVKPTAKAARGWCIVGWNTLLHQMDVCMLDDHGGPLTLGLYPFLVLDVYEHAYAEQYNVDRGTYLDHIYKSINWNVVEHRVAKLHSASELMRTSVPEEAEEYIRETFENQEDAEFGFPDEESYPDSGEPPATGLDHRKELSVQPNPRIHSSVVTQADIEQAYTRIKTLSKITFRDVDDMFDEEVKGKGREFRDTLWARLQEDSKDE